MVAAVSHERFFTAATAQVGFFLDAGAARLSCAEVGGFPEALTAAADPLAPAPSRLVIVEPAPATCAWIEHWAEDDEQVRREVLVRRARDGASVAVIATLASHGYGVPTALAVESVRARLDGDILRSGVHLRVDVEAVLAREHELGRHDPS
jgi:hypothetical protein